MTVELENDDSNFGQTMGHGTTFQILGRNFQTEIILQMTANIFFCMHQGVFHSRKDSSLLAMRRVQGKHITKLYHLAFYSSLLLAHLDIHEATLE